jgi:hypothetical protein
VLRVLRSLRLLARIENLRRLMKLVVKVGGARGELLLSKRGGPPSTRWPHSMFQCHVQSLFMADFVHEVTRLQATPEGSLSNPWCAAALQITVTVDV